MAANVEVAVRVTDQNDPQAIRKYEAVRVVPAGVHLTPRDIAMWLDRGDYSVVPENRVPHLQFIRSRHCAQCAAYTNEEQDKLQAFIAAGWTSPEIGGALPVPSFALTPKQLAAFDAAATYNHKPYELLTDGLSPEQANYVMKKTAREWFFKWVAAEEQDRRVFWNTHGYDTSDWGDGDLKSLLVMRMGLAYDDVQEIATPVVKFVPPINPSVQEYGELEIVKRARKRIDVEAVISPATLAELKDLSVVCAIRYDKEYDRTILRDADPVR